MASPQVQHPDSELDRSLTTLDNFLALLGFRQCSCLRATVSWAAFSLLAVALPLFALELLRCTGGCDKFEIQTFELDILVSRAVTAAISLLCVSRNLSKHGIRKALFVNRCHGHVTQFRKQYLHKIRVFYCLLASWFGVCFLLKAAREVTRLVYMHHGPLWLSVTLFFVCLLSWSYSTLVFLSGCALFHLVGNLQIIHFENYGKLLERDLDVSAYIEEHMNLSYDLSKISHRFRIFLLLEFLVITASQFMSLLQTTENQGIINFINGGDFAVLEIDIVIKFVELKFPGLIDVAIPMLNALRLLINDLGPTNCLTCQDPCVLSIVQLVGIVLCLNVAAKISHRAQSLGSIASRWHALVTCNSNEDLRSAVVENSGNSEFCTTAASLSVNYSESDLESADYMPLPANVQPTSSTSYNRRQAFVAYVQSNTGGFTIFGWVIDRILINTIFFTELSLVFFVLGKTVTITVR
ncbi:hypothetical protein STAS_12619 [Striga asiatica]|uniref:Uncharacterized protein n=1 Tax=Striga asiatica TaxID=4170 RepID=A0A5A7PTZ4_STRAF|nr:hypothetical protein STAS_12619 [Striga asiatica]